MKKIIGKCFIILIAGALGATLLLALCFMLPVRDQIYVESLTALESEGWYPAVPIMSASLDTYFHSFLPGVLDGNTDHIMLDTALNITGPGNALYRAMDMFSEYMGTGYSYYWHGYVSILRPLMLVFNYGEIRVINGVIQLLIIMVTVFLIGRKKGLCYAAIFLSSYFLLMPDALSFSLQFSWVFYIGMGGCLYVLRHGESMMEKNRYLYVFLILGMLTSFLDLLTYPLYTWAIPLLWWLVTAFDNTDSTICKLCKAIASGITWIAGYGGFWMLKWCLGSVIMGRNIWESALYEVFMRSGLEEAKEMNLVSRWEALSLNWKHYSYKLYVLLLVSWLIWIIVQSIRHGFRSKTVIPALGLVGISPVVWYVTLANHTAGHHFFTYRIWSIAILASLLLGVEIIDTVTKKGLLKRAFGWLILLVSATIWTMAVREDFWILNGESNHTVAELPAESRMEIVFQPSFSGITQYSLGIDSPGTEGKLILELYDDERQYDEICLDLSEIGTKTFYPISVDWQLDPRQSYMIALTAEGADDTGIMLTVPEEIPMTEYKGVTIDQAEWGGQPISGIMYRKRPGIAGLILPGITRIGILFVVSALVYSCLQKIEARGTIRKKKNIRKERTGYEKS